MKRAKEYDKKTVFTKKEVEQMNQAAYNLGINHILEAANLALGIGEKRKAKILEKLEFIQDLDFGGRL